MGRIERTREIARRRKRGVTVKKLRKEYQAAKTESEKADVQAKLLKISPFATLEG